MVVLGRQAGQLLVAADLRLVARDRAPCGLPRIARVENGRHRPVRPGDGLSLHAIHDGNETLQRRLVRRPRLGRPGDEVQLADRVRRALRLAIQRVRGGGPDDGGHRQLGHGDVIRVAVRAIRAECEHDLRPRTANRGGDAARGLDRIGAIELFVGIPEQEQFVNAERRGGRAELAHANGRQGLLAGVQRMVLRVSAVAARFAVGGRDHRHRRSLAGIPRQRGAEPERLIVRVGDDGHETERGHGSLWSGRPRPFGRSFPRARNYKRRAGCRERCVILALPRAVTGAHRLPRWWLDAW